MVVVGRPWQVGGGDGVGVEVAGVGKSPDPLIPTEKLAKMVGMSSVVPDHVNVSKNVLPDTASRKGKNWAEVSGMGVEMLKFSVK